MSRHALLRPPIKGKGGRPLTFDRTEITGRICAGLEQGTPMTVICAKADMPSPRQVMRWAKEDEEVKSALASARAIGFDAISEECLAIADDATGDWTEDDEGNLRVNHENIARAKVRVEARLKLLAVWDPSRFGEKLVRRTVSVVAGLMVMTAEKLADLQARKRASILRNRERMLALPGIGHQPEEIGTASL